MSDRSKVSDEEMRYFQFKARQFFLLRREDHEWREFCKQNSCECCSCPPADEVKPKKGTTAAVRAPPRKAPTSFAQTTKNPTSVHSRTLPKALNEIKTKLERIDLALSGRTQPAREEQTLRKIFSEIQLPSSISQVESLQNPETEKRLEFVQNCLKQSLLRLQSSALQKNTKPQVNIKKRNSSFVLPHKLQKQRSIARNAYLASLTKFKGNSQPSSSIVKEKNLSKQVNPRQKTQSPKVLPKIRNKKNLQLEKKKQDAKLASSSQEVKDENIESAIDGIVDELMGETVLLLNKIKQIKSGQSVDVHHPQTDETPPPRTFTWEGTAEQQNEKMPSSSNWAKIRQSLLHFKTLPEEKSNTQNSKFSSPENQNVHGKSASQVGSPDKLPQNTTPHITRELLIDLKTSQDIVKHRQEYEKYLERISRTKKGNFDPWTLTNMISEFLLDEYIDDVAKEIGFAQGSTVAKLKDQEFLQLL